MESDILTEYDLLPTEAGRALECDICFETALHPGVTACGHLFCEPCVKKWFDWEKQTCPSCRQAVGGQFISLSGRGRVRRPVGVGSPAIRQAKRCLFNAPDLPELRRRANILMKETELSNAALEQLKIEIWTLSQSKIETLRVSLISASSDEMDLIHQRLNEAREALVDWEALADWELDLPDQPESLLEGVECLINEARTLHLRFEVGVAAGLLKAGGGIEEFREKMEELHAEFHDTTFRDGDWLRGMVCRFAARGRAVRVSVLKTIWTMTPMKPVKPEEQADEKQAFLGVSEAVLDCDPIPLVFPGVSSLILGKGLESESLDAILSENFPNVWELTTKSSHNNLLINASLHGIKCLNIVCNDFEIHHKMDEAVFDKSIVIRRRTIGTLWRKDRSAGTSDLWCRKFRNSVATPAGGLRLTQPTGEAKEIADLPEFTDMLTGHRSFWWLPFEAPKAALQMFQFVVILKKELFRSYTGPPFTAAFVRYGQDVAMGGFNGKLAKKRSSARRAFDALNFALHQDDVLLAVLDETSEISDTLDAVPVEQIFADLESQFRAEPSFTRRWVLPDERTLNIDMSQYEDGAAAFEADVAWMRNPSYDLR